jgi:excisionase family DNA binding protein
LKHTDEECINVNRTATPTSLNGRQSSAPVNQKVPARPGGAPWSMRDAAAYWGVSERHVAGLAAANKIRTIKIGARRLVPADEVERVAHEGC